METGILISIGALIVAALGLILNAKKDTKADAATLAKIESGMNTANSGITDIRVDLRSLQSSINDHSERLARVESRVENNSRRLDMLEGKAG